MAYVASRWTFKNLLPLIFVASTIFIIWFVYVWHHLGYLLQLSKPALEVDAVRFRRGCAEAVVSQILTALVLVSYIRCVLTEPGGVPEGPEWLPDGPEVVRAPSSHELKLSTGQRRHCKWCGRWKPDRCHHCRVCKRCVLKMDHHCPWIMNCVGFHNHKYFFLVVFYSVLDCLFISICMMETMQRLQTSPMPSGQRFLIVFVITVVLFLGCLLTTFLCGYTWLAFQDMTTIEFCEKTIIKGNRSLYDRGILQNMYKLFGPHPALWLLPISGPGGEGVVFSRNDDTESMLPQYEQHQKAEDKVAELRDEPEPEWTASRE